MKSILLALFVLVAVGCGNPKQGEESGEAGLMQAFDGLAYPRNTKEEVNVKEAKRIIEKNKFRSDIVSADFGVFKKFMARLNSQSIYSITTAADYVSSYLAKAGEKYRDSTYLYFTDVFHTVAGNKSDSIYVQFPEIIKKIERNEPDADTEALEVYFDLFGLDLISSMGQLHLEAEPDYFLKIFGNHVSKSLNEFINERYLEVDKGFSEGGKLIISFKDVHDRAVKWDDYVQKYPESIVKGEADFYFNTYMETLLTGLDNSHIYNDETGVIIPEVKDIYESVIKEGAKNRSTGIIKGFYQILKANQFKYTEDLGSYLNDNGLHSMLGKQPYIR